ncbi:metallophosphoesterase family protein [Noviherbaspirillum malthae]|uniref:metallophosphoesterase family protein n=1 Tax=Noviherbaspirillum malthae TaxID=1260987 RepID=UPI001E35F7EE|nr:metallophosphoesterase [Noviherbaspirillum malthae]
MQIAHMSDLHYCPENLAEADRCFGFAVDDAIRKNADVAIISGDSTDHRLDAHSPALLALARQIKRLADHCPVLMLQGTFSHEPFGMLRMLELIGAKHPIAIADRIGQIGLTDERQWKLSDTSDINHNFKLVVTCMPTVNKADLALMVGAENASAEMGEHLAALLGHFHESNSAYRRLGIPTVLTSHGTVDGSMNETGVPMAGLDHEFTAGALFSSGADACMLGHIHKHQAWRRDFDGNHQVIAYPGSIGRFHYGEIGEKHYLLWTVQPGFADFDAVVTPSRRMIDIEFMGIPNLDEIATVAKDCAGAYVRVTYKVDEEYAKTVDRNAIKQILGSCAEVKIVGEILSVQRQRCAGISRMPSIIGRFTKWCEVTDTSAAGLTDRLQLLQTMDPEDIASQIVRAEPLELKLAA